MARDTQSIDLTGCARCEAEAHPGVVFERLDKPMVGPDGTKWEWWAACPDSGQPILMRTTAAEPEVFACRR